MTTVVVDDSCLQADSQPKSGGLVWGSTAACALFCNHQMNRVNSRNGLWSWWQHYKYRPGIIIISIKVSVKLSSQNPSQQWAKARLVGWSNFTHNLLLLRKHKAVAAGCTVTVTHCPWHIWPDTPAPGPQGYGAAISTKQNKLKQRSTVNTILYRSFQSTYVDLCRVLSVRWMPVREWFKLFGKFRFDLHLYFSM